MYVLLRCLLVGGSKSRDAGDGNIRHHAGGEETTRQSASKERPGPLQEWTSSQHQTHSDSSWYVPNQQYARVWRDFLCYSLFFTKNHQIKMLLVMQKLPYWYSSLKSDKCVSLHTIVKHQQKVNVTYKCTLGSSQCNQHHWLLLSLSLSSVDSSFHLHTFFLQCSISFYFPR